MWLWTEASVAQTPLLWYCDKGLYSYYELNWNYGSVLCLSRQLVRSDFLHHQLNKTTRMKQASLLSLSVCPCTCELYHACMGVVFTC